MRTCAYCGASSRVTREHTFPNFLSKAYVDYRTYVDHTRGTLPRRSAPVTRDVCLACNGGPLSELDTYGAELNRRYFSIPVDLPIRIHFCYRYNSLLRWLLKLFYNDSRTRSETTSAYSQFIPYILGKANHPPLVTTLFLGIIEPVETNAAEQARGLGPILYPQVNRIGNLLIDSSDSIILARFIGFNSYLVTVLSWGEGSGRAFRRRIVRSKAWFNGMSELLPGESEVLIQNGCVDTRRYLWATILNKKGR